MASFIDLNLFPLNDNSEMLRACRCFGYKTVAMNHVVELTVNKNKKKDKKSSNSNVIEEAKKSKEVDSISSVRQLKRLSVALKEPAQLAEFQKFEKIKDYDIISVQPMTEKLFLTACKDLEIDIISLDFTERLPFFPKRSAVGCAIKRGIMFEVIYSPMIEDSTARRNIISNASLIVELSRGKNLIISSGCKEPLYLKSPYDVKNIALLFGLNEQQAKNAITSNPRSVIMHAHARKICKSVLQVHETTSNDMEE